MPLRALIYEERAVRSEAESALLNRALMAAAEAFVATEAQGSQISDTKASQGVYALLDNRGLEWETLQPMLPPDGPWRVVAMDGVGDPGNCRAILRACDWFGIDAVLMGKGCAELGNGKTVRASMGALFRLPVAVSVDLPAALRDLKDQGISLVAAELEGATRLDEYSFPERAVLIIGNEARGVSPWVSTQRVFVPRFGKAESLNAAMAAAVFLARWRL